MPPPQEMTFSNQTELSASMTILDDHIFSQGQTYHYPSGEYPTLLSRDLARTTVHDVDDTPANDRDRICSSPSSNFGTMPVDDDYEDVNFFGRFEQEERELALANAQPRSRYGYPAL
jgi:hypothetical protein